MKQINGSFGKLFGLTCAFDTKPNKPHKLWRPGLGRSHLTVITYHKFLDHLLLVLER